MKWIEGWFDLFYFGINIVILYEKFLKNFFLLIFMIKCVNVYFIIEYFIRFGWLCIIKKNYYMKWFFYYVSGFNSKYLRVILE